MGWFNLFPPSDPSATVEVCDATVIKGAPYDAHAGFPSAVEAPATLTERSDPQFAEEIKQRQLALLERYVATVRTH